MVSSEKLTHFFGQYPHFSIDIFHLKWLVENNTMFTTKQLVVYHKTTRRLLQNNSSFITKQHVVYYKTTRRIRNCKPSRNIRQMTIPREKEEDARARSFAKKRCCKNKFCNTSLFRLNRNISANEGLRMSSKSPQQEWQEVQSQSDLKYRRGLARHFHCL